MESKTYDRLKFVALVVLPALSAAYFTLSQIWNLPYVEQIVGTITVIDTLLGTILAKSSKDFREKVLEEQDSAEFVNMGHMTVIQDVDGHPMTVRLDLDEAGDNIFEVGKIAQFKIRREPYK